MLQAGVGYGAHPRQVLDIYRPTESSKAVVIFFYGGNWRSGSKDDYRFVAESLTRQSLTVAIPDYRVFPEIRFPAFVDDGARAVKAVREQVGAGTPIYLAGYSSGAHIAALLALDARYLHAFGMEASRLAGFIGIAGPYDFLPFTSERTAEVFAGTSDLSQTQPITFASREAPPTLLLHGTADRTVLPRNSQNLAARLRSEGASTRLILYPETEHVEILLALSSVAQGDSRVLADLADFVAG